MTIRVLIVDDDPIVRAAVQSYLERADDIEVVGILADGAQAVAAVTDEVDVLVMDVRMSVMDGLQATLRIREDNAERPRILLLTTFDDEQLLSRAIRSGASGLLLKTATPQAVVDAVRTVHNGSAVFSLGPLSRLVDDASPSAGSAPPGLHLNRREQQILTLLTQACSNAEIGRTLHLSESTVKTYVSTVMAKLGVDSRLKAVVRAFAWNLVPR